MWTQPRRVAERINGSTIRLNNKTIRNAAGLVPARPQIRPLPLVFSAEAAKVFLPQSAVLLSSITLRQSNRKRRPPAWHAINTISKSDNKNWLLCSRNYFILKVYAIYSKIRSHFYLGGRGKCIVMTICTLGLLRDWWFFYYPL